MSDTERTLKCDYCGRFVAYADLESGDARRGLVTPDSAFTSEEYETTCPSCTPEAEKVFVGVDYARSPDYSAEFVVKGGS